MIVSTRASARPSSVLALERARINSEAPTGQATGRGIAAPAGRSPFASGIRRTRTAPGRRFFLSRRPCAPSAGPSGEPFPSSAPCGICARVVTGGVLPVTTRHHRRRTWQVPQGTCVKRPSDGALSLAQRAASGPTACAVWSTKRTNNCATAAPHEPWVIGSRCPRSNRDGHRCQEARAALASNTKNCTKREWCPEA